MVSQTATFQPGSHWTPERQRASLAQMEATLASPEMQAIFGAIAESGGPPGERPLAPPAPTTGLTGITRDAIHYRRAVETDVSGIADLVSSADLPPLFIKEWIGGFVIADFNGQIAGYGGLEMYGESGVLRSIVIDERARGLGIGRTMSELLIEDGRRSGASDMYLFTEHAYPFWQRLGFTEIGLPVWKTSPRACWQYRFLSKHAASVPDARSMWRAA